MNLRRPVNPPKLLPNHKWCDTCGGEGIVWVRTGADDERPEQCEECDGDCQVELECEEAQDFVDGP